MNNFLNSSLFYENQKISGWGRNNFVYSKVLPIENNQELISYFKKSKFQSIIPRGLGRSYGDAAQLDQEFVANMLFSKEISFSGNEVTVGAGVSISELLNIIIPMGYFIPVSPGSANVTIGGAIAADVHGKNHHKEGSIGNHISRMLVLKSDGEIKQLKPNAENNISNFFWATLGGMGLTGIILEATIALKKIKSSFMKVDNFICKDLDSLMQLMLQKDKVCTYSVAWIDTLHKHGRGVLTCGEHADKNDLKSKISDVFNYSSNSIADTPNFLPNGLLNKYTVKAFNEFWYRKAKNKLNDIQTISQFFHPLDGISNWNRIYGTGGFYQYQFVIPDDKTYFISKTIEKLNKSSAHSFLTVLKRFGQSNNSFLSFPEPGWTLAIDIPGSVFGIRKILDELDIELSNIGGKLYLAKDTRQSSEIFKKTYKNYPKWKTIKNLMDPENIFRSDLSIRLNM